MSDCLGINFILVVSTADASQRSDGCLQNMLRTLPVEYSWWQQASNCREGLTSIYSIIEIKFYELVDSINKQQTINISNFRIEVFLFFLTRVYLPEDVKTIIKGPKFTINVYNYIPISNIKFFSVIFIKFDLDLTNPLLSDVGVNSDSSIYNIYPMLGCLFLVIMLHICLLFLIWWALRVKKTWCWNCLMNVAKVILNKLYTTMTFGFYIRNALQMSLFVLIFAVYELYKFNTDGIFWLISIAFSFLLLWFYLVFAFATLYLLLTSYKTDENRHNMFGEFFSGIKQSKQARFYVIIFLIRKATFVVLLLTLTSISSKIVIGILGAN